MAVSLAIGLLVFGVILLFTYQPPQIMQETDNMATTTPQLEINTYRSDAYGISFTYPEGYVLTEAERGDGHRGHYSIVLMQQEDLPLPKNGEGPPAVTIDIYQNNLDQMSLVAWLTTTNALNYKQGDGTYASTTVAGTEAIVNRWSGLYEGETTAFLHKDNLVAVSVTYFTPEDQIIDDYRGTISSLQLTP